VNGKTLLLRVGVDSEEKAGQLFAFLYRVLYGSAAKIAVDSLMNTSVVPAPSSTNPREK
jgi:hypothetical protein